jgi:hypothetical protein
MQRNSWINPLTDEEANVLRDGQKMRVPLVLRDHAPTNVTDADTQRCQQRGISLSQAQYENRLADAWKVEPPQPVPALPTQVGDNGQTAYERRVLNAWRGAL